MQQGRALTALSGSTWGASFTRAQLIYSAVVRPCLTYGVTIWAPLQGTLQRAKQQWIREPLERVQQQCLCAITRAFKATNRQVLEKEAAIPLLRAHIARLQLQSRARLEASGARQEIDWACHRLRSHLTPHRSPPPTCQLHTRQRATCLGQRYPMAATTMHGRHLQQPRPSPMVGQPLPRPRPHPTPQSLWQAYQLAEQWCWDCWWELKGGPPPPPPPPPPPHTTTLTQTPEVAGSQTRCPTRRRLSGYTLTSPSPTAAC